MILNPLDNALATYRRAEHIHHYYLTPITPLADDCLLS